MDIFYIVIVNIVCFILLGIFSIISENSLKNKLDQIFNIVNPKNDIADDTEHIVKMIVAIWKVEKLNQPFICKVEDREIKVYVDYMTHTSSDFTGGVYNFDVKFNDISVLRALHYYAGSKNPKQIWYAKNVNSVEVKMILEKLYYQLRENEKITFLK